MRCTIIGAGVSGLTCALELGRAGHQVQLVAESPPARTTSAVAAAFWYPYRAFPPDRVLQWARTAHRVFQRLCDDPEAGVSMVTALEAVDSTDVPPWWADAVPGLEPAPAAERPAGAPAAWKFRAPVIDTRRYLPWLSRAVESVGIDLRLQRVERLQDLPECDVVINCSGLGARELVGDRELVPVRGQIVHIQAPRIREVRLDERGDRIAYIVPRGDDVVLGGTAEEGVEDLRPRAEQTRAIVDACARLDPRVRDAPILGTSVGLRPARPTIRLEDTIHQGVRVIHNYGHGGAGITLSWGCAHEVASLVG